MQDTAEGFGQPIRHIFGVFFAMRRELPSPFDKAPRYRVTVGDRFWHGLYLPVATLVQRIADAFAWLQQGHIAMYLLYSFITLVVLLALAFWSWLWGPIGAFLAVPLTIVGAVTLHHLFPPDESRLPG